MLSRILLIVLSLAPLATGAQTHTYLDRSLQPAVAPVKKLLFIPSDVSISEISAGGVIEKVPDWGKQGREHVTAAMRKLTPDVKFQTVNVPTLTAAEQEILDQHAALYLLVAVNVRNNGLGGGSVWTKRLESGLTDYTVGPGLAFLAEKTGADAVMFTIVEDFVSSSGRKAMVVFGALFGVGLPLGRTFAVAGLLDLKTGKLLWQSYDTSGTPDMRVEADAERVVRDLFKSYPGSATAAAGK